MASPWAKIKPVDDGAVTLQQIAAEEIVKNLQEKYSYKLFIKLIKEQLINANFCC